MPQKTIYLKERTSYSAGVGEAGLPISVDAAEADMLLEEGFADTEPPAPVETHITFDTAEVPLDAAQPAAQGEPATAYDVFVSDASAVDASVEEADHTNQEPPVIREGTAPDGISPANTLADSSEVAPEGIPTPTRARPGTRRIPPEPEARVQLLKGQSLNLALRSRGLPVGTDQAAGKRERLLADFHEKGDVGALRAVVEKALEDA